MLHKVRKELIREIHYKAFTLFSCCLLGIRLVFTISMWGQHSDPGCHASLALLNKDRSLLVCTSRPLRAQSCVTVATLCTMETFPACSIHSSCVHSAAAGWETMENLFICFNCLFLSVDLKSKQFWKCPRSFLLFFCFF